MVNSTVSKVLPNKYFKGQSTLTSTLIGGSSNDTPLSYLIVFKKLVSIVLLFKLGVQLDPQDLIQQHGIGCVHKF